MIKYIFKIHRLIESVFFMSACIIFFTLKNDAFTLKVEILIYKIPILITLFLNTTKHIFLNPYTSNEILIK